ncbi:MAG: nucleotidyltransferase domain-containing protein [Thermoplasmata archaeon]|nr:MAG: nucleotidyltransferase domain-containing protein [Thermoplasmata archaeon]
MDRRAMLKKLKRFKDEITRKYNVERVILFGSYARGKIDVHSDADIIVVGNFKKKGNLNRAPLFYREWHLVHKIDLPVDFICYTPEEFERLKNQVSIVSEALKEGIEIK